MHSIKHWFTINVLPTMATENPQAFSREAFIFFCGGSIMTCITSFQQKQNVKDIFIDGHRRKEQQKDSDISKSIKKVKLWGHHRKWTWRSWLWHCKNWDPATARWYKSCYVLQKIKNRWVKKAKKPRKSLGFIETAIDLPFQWMVTPSSHTQGRKEERVVGTSFHGAVSLLIADCLD